MPWLTRRSDGRIFYTDGPPTARQHVKDVVKGHFGKTNISWDSDEDIFLPPDRFEQAAQQLESEGFELIPREGRAVELDDMAGGTFEAPGLEQKPLPMTQDEFATWKTAHVHAPHRKETGWEDRGWGHFYTDASKKEVYDFVQDANSKIKERTKYGHRTELAEGPSVVLNWSNHQQEWGPVPHRVEFNDHGVTHLEYYIPKGTEVDLDASQILVQAPKRVIKEGIQHLDPLPLYDASIESAERGQTHPVEAIMNWVEGSSDENQETEA